MPERDEQGRFLPGNSGGPGRPPAASVHEHRAALVNAVSPDDIRAVARMLVDKALAGNFGAAKVLLADVGTPPGFAVDPAGLDDLRSRGLIDRYTVAARGVILYIPEVKASDRLVLSYKLVARMPLRAVAPPTRVYPYYDPDRLASAAPKRFTVTDN